MSNIGLFACANRLSFVLFCTFLLINGACLAEPADSAEATTSNDYEDEPQATSTTKSPPISHHHHFHVHPKAATAATTTTRAPEVRVAVETDDDEGSGRAELPESVGTTTAPRTPKPTGAESTAGDSKKVAATNSTSNSTARTVGNETAPTSKVGEPLTHKAGHEFKVVQKLLVPIKSDDDSSSSDDYEEYDEEPEQPTGKPAGSIKADERPASRGDDEKVADAEGDATASAARTASTTTSPDTSTTAAPKASTKELKTVQASS